MWEDVDTTSGRKNCIARMKLTLLESKHFEKVSSNQNIMPF